MRFIRAIGFWLVVAVAAFRSMIRAAEFVFEIWFRRTLAQST